ncbi:MAG TPA: DUF222 domain-containing protein [Nocardioides sp.]
MFEVIETPGTRQPTPGADVPVDASMIARWTNALCQAAGAADGDSARIDALRALEELKCAAEAAQADLAVDLDTSMRARAADQGIPAERQGRGIAHQIALARRVSPHRGQRQLGLAKVLRTEMPHTMAAFRAGKIGEWKATLLARETACLNRQDRALIDRELAADGATLEKMSDRQVAAEAAKRAAKLDPASVVRRRAKAEADRRVTIRPAPDTMTYLTGLLPMAKGVSVYAALTQAADALKSGGDPRSRGQIMADILVARITGQDDASGQAPVHINLVVSDQTLLGGGNDTAHVDGFGPIPADLARELIERSLSAECETWLKTVYAGPHGGLVAMSSLARLVPKGLGDLLNVRDGGICRNLWCDAPIRHHDHATGVANGGETIEEDLQGLCQSCNYAKQAPGWSAAGKHPPGKRHQVETTTPTGHTYTSTAPPLPGQRERRSNLVVVEIHHRHDLQLDYAPAA